MLFDLSATFATIRIAILLDYIRSLFGTASGWFSMYLSDHCQPIKVGPILPDFEKLLFCIPLGSVLGPLMFSLYTTILTKTISKYPSINLHNYTDDTGLLDNISPESASGSINNRTNCFNDA